MGVVRKSLKDAAVGVAVAETPEGLSAIHRPGCAAAIWRRQPLAQFQTWIDQLDTDVLPNARVTIRPEMAPEVVSQICKNAGVPAGSESALLVDDIAGLADIYAGLISAPFLRLRLEAVSSNACRKFHIDAVTSRLVCTFRGRGTQYGISTDGAEPQRIFTVATGAPILLRGTLWPDGQKSGLLHRSPPIEGTGETRLVLVLDPIQNPEEDS